MSDLDFALCAEPGCLRVAKPDAGYCARHSAPVGGSAKRQDRVDGLDPKDEHAVGEAEAPTLNLGSDTARDALTKAAEAFRAEWMRHAAKRGLLQDDPAFRAGDASACDRMVEHATAADRSFKLAELCEAALTTLKTYEQGFRGIDPTSASHAAVLADLARRIDDE